MDHKKPMVIFTEELLFHSCDDYFIETWCRKSKQLVNRIRTGNKVIQEVKWNNSLLSLVMAMEGGLLNVWKTSPLSLIKVIGKEEEFERVEHFTTSRKWTIAAYEPTSLHVYSNQGDFDLVNVIQLSTPFILILVSSDQNYLYGEMRTGQIRMFSFDQSEDRILGEDNRSLLIYQFTTDMHYCYLLF